VKINLDRLIDVCATRSGSSDPHEVARLVAKEDEFVEYVAFQLDSHRDDQVISEDQSPPVVSVRKPVRSAKVTGIREAWKQRLDKLYYAGPGQGQKPLGKFNATELDIFIQIRRNNAEANLGAARTGERLKEALVEHKVEVVADLPDNVLRPILRGE
jgi:hypothetical protein